MTHGHVIAMACMAIWPVTVPKQPSRREVEMLSLPVEHFPNLDKKVQKLVEEVGQFVSRASMSCMTRLGMSTQWMMQDNCTSPSDLNKLWPKERMRRK